MSYMILLWPGYILIIIKHNVYKKKKNTYNKNYFTKVNQLIINIEFLS